MVPIKQVALVIVIGVLKVNNRLKFIKGEWYRHVKYKDLVLRIIAPVTEKTYRVEYYTLGYDPKMPRTLGVFNTFFFNGDEDWVLYE